MKDLGKSLNLAITIILSLVSGLILGYWLDSAFQTAPTFMVIGLLVGTGFAFLTLYNLASKK